MNEYAQEILQDFYHVHKTKLFVEWNQTSNVLRVQTEEKKEIVYRHCPELQQLFHEREPRNEYAMLHYTCGDVKQYWLYVKKEDVVNRFEFWFDERDSQLVCWRIDLSGHIRLTPFSMEAIYALLIDTMKEQPEYRLYALTQSIIEDEA